MIQEIALWLSAFNQNKMKKIIALTLAFFLTACGSSLTPQEKFDQAFEKSQNPDEGNNLQGEFSLSAEYEFLDPTIIRSIPKELISAFGNISATWDFAKEGSETGLVKTQLKFNSTPKIDFSLRGQLNQNEITYTISEIEYPFIQFIGMQEMISEEDFTNLQSQIKGQESIFPISEDDFGSIISSLKNMKSDAGIKDITAEQDDNIVQAFIDQNVIQITDDRYENGQDILTFNTDIAAFYAFLNQIQEMNGAEAGGFLATANDTESLQAYGEITLNGEDFVSMSGDIFLGKNLVEKYGYDSVLLSFDYQILNGTLALTLINPNTNQEIIKINLNWNK